MARPVVSVAFKTPSVTVSPTDEVPILLTLSVSGEALNIQNTGPFESLIESFGVDTQTLSGSGFRINDLGESEWVNNQPFASFTSISPSTYSTWNLNAGPCCDRLFYSNVTDYSAYTSFNYWDAPLYLEAGSSMDLLWGVLKPLGGYVEPGVYSLYSLGSFNLGFGFYINGESPDGAFISDLFFSTNATCHPAEGAECDLTINVVSSPVPEPKGVAMLLLGLGVVGGSVRRRKQTA